MTVLSWFQKSISGSRTTTHFYPYKTFPLQPAHVNKELKVGELEPLSDIDEYIVAEYPKKYSALIPLLQRQVLCVDTTASTPSTLR